MEVEGVQGTSQTVAQLGKSVEDNAGTGGGGEALFTLQIMSCCWLSEEEGVRRVGIMVWMVRRDQVASVVRGKLRHKFVMEVQMGSQVNAVARALATMEEWVPVGLVKVVSD